MSALFATLWQLNIEFSLLLVVTLIARYAIRWTTKIYNSYLLWLSIPIGLLAASLSARIQFSQPPVETMNYMAQSYLVVPASSIDNWQAWGVAWLFVATVLLSRLLRQHMDLRRDLRAISVNKQLQLNSSYPVVGIDKTNFSPAVYGFVRPTIYFPVQLLDDLSPEQIKLIISHEEHHIKQRHLWLNLFWDVLVCLMWFNPFAYISRQSFRHDQELYCDYLVLHNSSKHSQKSYGYALLSTVSATHSVSLLCSWKTFNQIEERIMNINKSTSLSSKILISIFGLAIVVATSLYTVSAADYPEHEKQVIKIVQDDSDSKMIELQKNQKIFKQKGDNRYVEESGVERQMTEEEAAIFEEELRKIEKHMPAIGDGPRHKKIKIIRGPEDVDISGLDLHELTEELREMEIEILGQHDEFGVAKRELEMARKEVEAAHAANEISARAKEKALSQLEATRDKLGANEAKMRAALERARADIEKLRQSMEESRHKAG